MRGVLRILNDGDRARRPLGPPADQRLVTLPRRHVPRFGVKVKVDRSSRSGLWRYTRWPKFIA